jgi:uncharacterized damage-inducible protein DinB
MEKEKFLQHREREYQTTMRVFKAYPHGKEDVKPGERSMSAKELFNIFVSEELVLQRLLKGEELFTTDHPPVSDIAHSMKEYERLFKITNDMIRASSQEELDEMTKFFVAPKTMGDVRKMDILWLFFLDSIHHRGQLSVYLRVVGAKVPSIYGPSGDEPWT